MILHCSDEQRKATVVVLERRGGGLGGREGGSVGGEGVVQKVE